MESFFDPVARELGLKQQTVSSAFYGFMKLRRPLPLTHKNAYVHLAGIDPQLIDAIEKRRVGPATPPPPPPPDLMADLKAQIAEIQHEVRRVDHRVSRLEDQLVIDEAHREK